MNYSFFVTNFFFFFNDTATTEIYTLSLHDALPICIGLPQDIVAGLNCGMDRVFRHDQWKVEEQLLAFPGGDTVLFPILREVGLIPIKPFKPEQSLHARLSLYMATIYRWALPRQRLPLNDPPELIRCCFR